MASLNEGLVVSTLKAALVDAAGHATEAVAASLHRAAEALIDFGSEHAPNAGTEAGVVRREPAPGLPAVGASLKETFVVASSDTASSMGHPDPLMSVLGSPRLALWFELVSTSLLPGPESGVTSVGVGILVHHLGRADLGEEVTVGARMVGVEGRRVLFDCKARCGDRLVGFGTHHRVLLRPERSQL